MSSSRRRFAVRHPVVVDVGCHCRRTKFSSLFSSSKPRSPRTPSTFSTSSSTTMTTSATTPSDTPSSLYSASESPMSRRRRRRATGKVEGESVAVVKETSKPYEEFKESMVQMIVEKEMYSWDDLRDLLHRFLALNSPRHHPLILRAFADVCRGVFSPATPGR